MTIGTMVCVFIAFLLTWIAPALFGALIGRGRKGFLSAVVLGLLAGFVSAWMTRSPISNGTSLGSLTINAAVSAAVSIVIRLVCLKLCGLLNKDIALSYGIGIGQGLMAQLIRVGLLYLNNMIYGLMLFVGTLNGFLTSAGLNAKQAKSLTDTLSQTPASMFLLSGFEQYIDLVMPVLGSLLLALFIKKGKSMIGIPLGFALEFIYRLGMMLLDNFASRPVQYLILSLLTVISGAAVYFSVVFLVGQRKEKAQSVQSNG